MSIKFWKKEKPKAEESKEEPTKTKLQIECEKYNRLDLYPYLQYVPHFPDRLEKEKQIPPFQSAFVSLYKGLLLEKDNPEEAEKEFKNTREMLEKIKEENREYANDAEKILENFDDVKKILAEFWEIKPKL